MILVGEAQLVNRSAYLLAPGRKTQVPIQQKLEARMTEISDFNIRVLDLFRISTFAFRICRQGYARVQPGLILWAPCRQFDWGSVQIERKQGSYALARQMLLSCVSNFPLVFRRHNVRAALCTAILLFALPALAADAKPDPPPSPSPVSYEVWGFMWDGRQYVKQPTHCLKTTDLKQAADYATQIDSYAGWSATTNLPDLCFVHTVFNGPRITRARPSASPDIPTYSVWAFTQKDGKWVKDEKYSWTTPDPLLGLEYAKKVNAVAGWSATTNCPQPVPPEQRYVNGGMLHGAANNFNFGPGIQARADSDGGQTIYFMGMSVRLGPDMVRNLRSGNTGNTSFYDSNPSYDNSSDIQNMINTQDMINNQQMNNNMQDMINTQNMLNTQQMNNDMQNMINAQNLSNSFNPP
jgi:hypothetical protein